MCVYSAILDHGIDKWTKPFFEQQPNIWPADPKTPAPPNPYLSPTPAKTPTPEEIQDFIRLLEAAKQYDQKHGEPECELEEKKETLRRLAKQLGVEIEFP